MGQTICYTQQTIPMTAPNRPLLQLADHLLYPADQFLHCLQQTIVTAGRPFVTPSRPIPPLPSTDHCYSWQTIYYTQQTIPSNAFNRPLLQLADHLLHPADHSYDCPQQTIVTVGRPFVTPSRPFLPLPSLDHCYSWQTICYTQQTNPSTALNRPLLQLAPC